MKKNNGRKVAGRLCFVAAIAILIAAIIYYYPKIRDYIDNIITYNDIRDRFTGDDPDKDKDPGKNTDDDDVFDNIIEGTAVDTDDGEDEISKYLRSLGLDPDTYYPITVDGAGLYAENNDYIGWIYVPQTAISYPVVMPVDNDEYLHADFYRDYNYAGTIFLDANCEDGLENHHTILYGHNMRVGTMFAGLNQFRSQSYVNEHPIFWFITPDEYIAYVIFSVCTPNPYDRTFYGIDGYDFTTDAEYQETIDAMVSSSIVTVPIQREVSTNDYIMSLSTCTGDDSFRCMVDGILDRTFDSSITRRYGSVSSDEESYEETEAGEEYENDETYMGEDESGDSSSETAAESEPEYVINFEADTSSESVNVPEDGTDDNTSEGTETDISTEAESEAAALNGLEEIAEIRAAMSASSDTTS